MKSSTPWRKIQWILPSPNHPIPLPKLSESIEEVRDPKTPKDRETFRIQVGLEVLNSSIFQSLVEDDVRIAISAESDLLTQPDVWDDLMMWSEEKT